MKRVKESNWTTLFDLALGPLIDVFSFLDELHDSQVRGASGVFRDAWVVSTRYRQIEWRDCKWKGEWLFRFLKNGGKCDKLQQFLYWASVNGHTETVRLLLADPRVDPSDGNNGAIRAASRNGHTEIVRLLRYAVQQKV